MKSNTVTGDDQMDEFKFEVTENDSGERIDKFIAGSIDSLTAVILDRKSAV